MNKKRGRPLKKKKPIKSFVKDEPIVQVPSGPLCMCGQPVAPGQTSVCVNCQKSH